MELYQDLKQGERGAWISIIAYIALSALKLIAAYLTNSAALMADGLNNATDIVASLAVLIGLKISRKPPDQDHPYGHFRAETISALIASFIMAVIGIDVVRKAIMSLMNPAQAIPDLMAAWVSIASAAVMYGVYRYNLALAKKINNRALMAAAQDNRSDALVSIGAFLGIIGSQFGLAWMDSLTAGVVGIIICKTAWGIFHDASHTLTDGFDNPENLAKYKQTIQKIHGVKHIADLKARIHGNRIFLDVTIHVDPDLSIKEGHDIADKIELKMRRKHHIHQLHIHIEPASLKS